MKIDSLILQMVNHLADHYHNICYKRMQSIDYIFVMLYVFAVYEIQFFYLTNLD